uniref:Uncharacterized protein n=1 Tax=Plectus sambesii TaxID=2011161 RepID=A0A914VYR0_9BILA
MATANESASDQLIRLMGEEYQREQRNEYGGLRALCQAARNLPVYPKISEKEEKKLNVWKKEVTKALTKKKSAGALKVAELKQNIRAKRGPCEQQNESITAVELMSYVPELVSILKTSLCSFLKEHPTLFWICIQLFVNVLCPLLMNGFSPIGLLTGGFSTNDM